MGISPDTGAERSVIGIHQAKAYCRQYGIRLHLSPSQYAFKFGDATHRSLDMTQIQVPINSDRCISLMIDVVDANIPCLIGLDVLDREQIVPDNVLNELRWARDGWSLPIVRKHGHMFIEFNPSCTLFTTSELQKLHLHFYHPSARKLYNLIKRAKPKNANQDTLSILESIAKECSTCKSLAPRPYRFRVRIPPDEVLFNQELAIDLMWIEGNAVLHVVDTATRFQNAVFFKGQSTDHIWDAFIEACCTVYVGYPSKIRADQGSVFTSRKWKKLCSMTGIELQLSGVESRNSIGVGERYHGPLRRIYRKVLATSPQMDPEIALRLAIKAANDTMGPEGLVPSLLLFGTIPRFPELSSSLPNQIEKMAALSAAREEMATIMAKLRIQKALRSKLPPATKYLVLPGDDVFVYREQEDMWTGPYPVVKVSNKQVFVQNGTRTQLFSIHQIMPHKPDAADQDMERLFEAMTQFTTSSPISEACATEVLPLNDPRQHGKEFDKAKQKEIAGLKRRGTFAIVNRDELPPNANIMGGRLVLSIKNKGTDQELYKARFVVQGHTDSEKNLLIHNGTNLKQSSIRLIAAVAAISGFRLWSQDVTQAYLQSSETLQREVYVRPGKEFNLQPGQLLKLLKPLYGLADAGDYWHATMSSHLKQDLGLQPCLSDLSLYHKREDGKLSGIVGSYVDDNLMDGPPKFEKETLKTQERFDSRKREEDNFTFAGIEINTTENGFHLHQASYCKRIIPLPEEASFEEFRSKRHQLAWLVHTRPDLAVAVNLSAQVTESLFGIEDTKRLNAAIALAPTP